MDEPLSKGLGTSGPSFTTADDHCETNYTRMSGTGITAFRLGPQAHIASAQEKSSFSEKSSTSPREKSRQALTADEPRRQKRRSPLTFGENTRHASDNSKEGRNSKQ
jgi:hypothetical protein